MESKIENQQEKNQNDSVLENTLSITTDYDASQIRHALLILGENIEQFKVAFELHQAKIRRIILVPCGDDSQ